MPQVHSAALLAYRRGPDGLAVFLAHMGGPFWAHQDAGAWSIPKGLYDPAAEDPLAAARREFAEEIGTAAPLGETADLGEFRQRSGKLIRAFAVAVTGDVQFVVSNTFDLEWPRGSGRMQSFPEIDRAQWFDLPTARRKMSPGQLPLLDSAVLAKTSMNQGLSVALQLTP